MQNRLKSKVLWVSTFSLILFILKTYLNIEVPNSDELINLILATGTAYGIFNNPTDNEKF